MPRINLNELTKFQMDFVKAGVYTGDWESWLYEDDIFLCACGCYYADSGGSSIESNHIANAITGANSPLHNPAKSPEPPAI